MPKRTNLFQEVVEIIHRHMAGNAIVESSALLPSHSTGALREVDVVIRAQPVGYEVIVSIEAIDRSRKATREWVDQMVGKHADLPTSKLVLVSARGFTSDARTAAVAADAVPLAPEDVATDATKGVVLAVRSLWPKLVTFTPETYGVKFDDEDAPTSGWRDEAPAVYLADGTQIVPSLGRFVRDVYQDRWLPVMDQLGLSGIRESETRTTTLRFDDLHLDVNGVKQALCLRNMDDGRLYPLRWIKTTGTFDIQVGTIPLTGRRLGEVDYAFGKGELGDREVLAVVTREPGLLTLRIRPEGTARSSGSAD